MNKEPKEAFPYIAPSSEIKKKYMHIFSLTSPLPSRWLKSTFDKFFASSLLLIGIPILVILKIAYVVEGILIAENKGPLFFSYNAVSQGKVFPKFKIRLIKTKHIDKEAAKRGEWIAYAAEWNSSTRTYVGGFVKKFYLDEIPQLLNILRGEMSIVGPRPLAVIHYERDCKQGNVSRKLLKGGLLGLGHIMKGNPEFGNPVYEYEYIHQYLRSSNLSLFLLDCKIIIRGLLVVFKGKGL